MESSSGQRIKINKNYLPTAIVHLILTACVEKRPTGTATKFSDTVYSYIAFSIVGFVISVFFFVINILNIANVGAFARVPWILIILITDAIMAIPILVLAIFSAIREDEVRDLFILQYYIYKGAFASAAAFGFLSTILYVVSVCLQRLRMSKSGLKSNIPAAS